MRDKRLNQKMADELRYSDPKQVEEWRRSGIQEVGMDYFFICIVLLKVVCRLSREPAQMLPLVVVLPISAFLRHSHPRLCRLIHSQMLRIRLDIGELVPWHLGQLIL
jgi:hypothetical protein